MTVNLESDEVVKKLDFLSGSNALYIEELYKEYRQDRDSVNSTWQEFFDNVDDNVDLVHPSWQRSDWPLSDKGELTSALVADWQDMQSKLEKIQIRQNGDLNQEELRRATLDSVRAIMMIRAYRVRGHLAAELDPLKLEEVVDYPELNPASYGFTKDDMERPIFIDHVLGLEVATVTQMLKILRRTYCGHVALEFFHISVPEEKAWLQDRLEGPDKRISFSSEDKKRIFVKLLETEGLEKFIDVKYTGTKRFGLDGGEAAIVALEEIIKSGSGLGVEEVVIGMPHRGRLNVLTNVMGKPFRALFNEFKGGNGGKGMEGSGDVKYHLGTSVDREYGENKVHLSLEANPSHLEAVDPVVLGKARAKQDKYIQEDGSIDRGKVIPLLLHGDAAFAGQGVVAECFGLSGLMGHKSGGSIHFIVNNQIGFTTDPRFSRSSPYPSDVGKIVETPIFHVNGDDPEAVVFAAQVATEFRQKFLKPVVIDMFCYRRFGHNEGDDPAFTQPHMYAQIKKHDSVVKKYRKKLIEEGVITEQEADKLMQDYRNVLEKEFEAASTYKPSKTDWLDGQWLGLTHKNTKDFIRGETGVELKTLLKIGKQLTKVPKDFVLHRTLQRQNKSKEKMFETGKGVDWATAEALAFGSLIDEGYPVRLSGQDCERGTFSQRHSVWIDQTTQERYRPLDGIKHKSAKYEVINSMLSEMAVLGFEYGYTLAAPNALVIWEAQFGDFANGAQVIMDQFISSSETKWGRMTGLVQLLPHGYEGQGPEHSSARLERYLQLCAEENMQVANVTTPANYFHILRRQLHRNYRKPLVLMSPKSLLRHKKCVSDLSYMEKGSSFRRIFWDGQDERSGGHLNPPKKIRRLILCSGKVYYDLLEARDGAGIKDVYIMRIEQLYPFPESGLIKALSVFAHAEMVWCQEEPRNMGAWSFIESYIEDVLKKIEAKHTRPVYVGRVASASTATGFMAKHLEQRDTLIREALDMK